MRFAYADPPYPGMAHMYRDHPDYAGEVDHAELIHRLVKEFPDGWALSTAEVNLQDLLAIAPKGIRILPWCQSNPVYRPPNRLVIAWQPLLMYGGRRPKEVTLGYLVSKNGTAFLGEKPEIYCDWLFRCLGALPGDELIDLFPGSGAVSRAWEKYSRQIAFPTLTEKGKQAKLEEVAG